MSPKVRLLGHSLLMFMQLVQQVHLTKLASLLPPQPF